MDERGIGLVKCTDTFSARVFARKDPFGSLVECLASAQASWCGPRFINPALTGSPPLLRVRMRRDCDFQLELVPRVWLPYFSDWFWFWFWACPVVDDGVMKGSTVMISGLIVVMKVWKDWTAAGGVSGVNVYEEVFGEPPLSPVSDSMDTYLPSQGYLDGEAVMAVMVVSPWVLVKEAVTVTVPEMVVPGACPVSRTLTEWVIFEFVSVSFAASDLPSSLPRPMLLLMMTRK